MATASLSRESSVSRSSLMDSTDIFVCQICLESYDDSVREPKFLNCHHSFCRCCLNQVATDQESIECPACRQLTKLGANGIGGLQTNFYLSYMKETFTKLGVPKIKGCERHSNQPMSFFCQACGVPICRDCVVVDHKESAGHIVQDLNEAETQHTSELDDQVKEAKTAMINIQGELGHLEAEASNLMHSKDAVLRDLDVAFEGYHKMLDQRKLQLTKEVFEIFNQKQTVIVEKMEQLGAKLKSLTGSIDKGDKLLKRGPLAEKVVVRKQISTTLSDIEGIIKDTAIDKNCITLNGNTGGELLKKTLASVGEIKVNAFLPTKVKFHVQDMIACLPARLTMEVFSYSEERLSEYPIGLKVLDPSLATLPCQIVPDDKLYNITFLPQMSGTHKLVPTFHEQPIKGTETNFEVQSNNPVSQFGFYGMGQGRFSSPRAVALDREGNMFVADTGNKLIQRLDSEGTFIDQFKINGGNDDCSTCDLALDLERNEIVCTETVVGNGVNPVMGSTVVKYTTDGIQKDRFTNNNMKCALCVASNTHGEIIVSDYLVHSLFVFDNAGLLLRRIGTSGAFNHPAFICVGPNDKIIVSDTNNDCVQVLSRDGRFLFQFGSSGSNKGELRQPFGVATDGENILVVDSGNKRVQVFSSEGKFVSMIQSKEVPLDQPRGLAVTNDGHVLVTDRDNHCIKKFKYK